MLILANKMPQLVTVSIRKDGQLVDLKLGPHAQSEPLADDCLTDHARVLIAQGHLRQRRA